MADLTINAALVNYSNQATLRREYSLGFASAQAGQIVVLNSSNQWVKVDANGSVGTNYGDTIGMLATGGNTNQPAVVIQEDPGLNVGAVLTNGISYWGSPNAGAVAPAADVTTGNVAILLGVARSTSVINFKPITTGATV